MDFSSSQKYIQTQTLLNTINGQFQNLNVQENGEKAGNRATPLSRSSSLMESLGLNEVNNNGSASPFNSFISSTNSNSHVDASSIVNKDMSSKTLFQNEANVQSNYNSLYGSSGLYGSNTPLSSFQTLTTPVGKSTIAAETYGFVNSFIAQPVWKYIDVQGNVQGPFSSSDMTAWYLQGYFQPTLSVFRANNDLSSNTTLQAMCNRFFSLSELVVLTQSSQDPFNSFDSMLSKPEVSQPEIANPIPNHISNPLMKLAEKDDIPKIDKKDVKNEMTSALDDKSTSLPKENTQKPVIDNLPSLINDNVQKSENSTANKSRKFIFKDDQSNDRTSTSNVSEKTLGNIQKDETDSSKNYELQNQSISTPTVDTSTSWTKIAAKNVNTKPVLKNQTSKNTIDPAKLRSVSSTPVNKTIGTTQSHPRISTVNAAVPVSSKEEFLKWCKKNMRLNSGLSKANVVELLLSMPSDVESEIIVAETIYSSSDVMDGRRFAKEFIKRRTECENNNDPLDWNEAIKLYIGNDDDDWEFQVVSKKKKN